MGATNSWELIALRIAEVKSLKPLHRYNGALLSVGRLRRRHLPFCPLAFYLPSSVLYFYFLLSTFYFYFLLPSSFSAIRRSALDVGRFPSPSSFVLRHFSVIVGG
jgi:hypothetical protein